MANLPAQQAQYVKYAEKDKNGIEIAGLGDVVEMNGDRTEMTIGTKLVVDGDISTEDDIAGKDIIASGDVSVGDDLTVAGDLNITGAANIGTLEFTSASVAGNLSAGGDVTTGDGSSLDNTAKVVSGSEYINEYYPNEGDITYSNLPTNLTTYYSHWRVSNGKLSVVMTFYLAKTNDIAATTRTNIATITIPSWVGLKLYSIIGTMSGVLEEKVVTLTTANSRGVDDYFGIRITKDSNTSLVVSFICEPIQAVSSYDRAARVEFNFLL